MILYPLATGLKHFIEVTILPTWLILLHRWLLPEFSHLIQPISKVRWVCISFYGVEFTHRIQYTRHITVVLCISPCFFILYVFTNTPYWNFEASLTHFFSLFLEFRAPHAHVKPTSDLNNENIRQNVCFFTKERLFCFIDITEFYCLIFSLILTSKAFVFVASWHFSVLEN